MSVHLFDLFGYMVICAGLGLSESCQSGKFGFNCQGICRCQNSQDCDVLSGSCRSGGCATGYDGPGCQYDLRTCKTTERGKEYIGTKDTSGSGVTCQLWTRYRFTGDQFPASDGGVSSANNYCRNPDNEVGGPWCYKNTLGWEYCEIPFCSTTYQMTTCEPGSFGANCVFKCNCLFDSTCVSSSGACSSGCAYGYKGTKCYTARPQLSRSPTGIQQTVTSDSITLQFPIWSFTRDKGEGTATKYLVQYREDNLADIDSNWYNSSHFTPTSEIVTATITRLSDNKYYVFRVIVIDGDLQPGFPGPTSTRIRTKHCLLPAINLNYTTSKDDSRPTRTQINVTWEQPEMTGCSSTVTWYRVWYQLSANQGRGTHKYAAYGFKWTNIDSLYPYADYNIEVDTLYNNGVTVNSDILRVKTSQTPPSAVRSLQCTTDSATSIEVSWSSPATSNGNIATYKIEYCRVGEIPCVGNKEQCRTFSEYYVVDSVGQMTQMTLINNLRPYSQYTVRVYAVNGAGAGALIYSIGQTDEADRPEGKAPLPTFFSKYSTGFTANINTFPCEYKNGEPDSSYPYKYELLNMSDGTVLRDSVRYTYNMVVTLRNLVPYTNYSLKIKFCNTIGCSELSEPLVVTTTEDKPPAPQNVSLADYSSNYLKFTWLPPDPPHGIITKYEVCLSRKLSESPIDNCEDETGTFFIFRNLNFSTEYLFKVYAYTKEGKGPEASGIGKTVEGKPDPPNIVTARDITETTANLEWKEPGVKRGSIVEYEVACKQIRFHKTHTDFENLFVPLKNLAPGTRYTCSVKAKTKTGYGPTTDKTFWTVPTVPAAPVAPKVEYDKQTNTTITLQLSKLSGDGATKISVYRLVVKEVATAEARKKRSSALNTFDLSKLMNYTASKAAGLAYYIAAEILPDLFPDKFVVGDGKIHGGYYNAPLVPEHSYDILWGAVSRAGQFEKQSYVSLAEKSGGPIKAKQYLNKTDFNKTPMIIAGVSGAVIGAVILIVLLMIFVRRQQRKKDRSKKDNEACTENRTFTQVASSGSDDEIHIKSKPKGKLFISFNKKKAIKKGRPPALPPSDSAAEDETSCEEAALYANTGVDSIKPPGPIKVRDYKDYLKNKKNDTNNPLTKEYLYLPKDLQSNHDIASKLENKRKNRYQDIVAYDYNRVVLDKTDNDPFSDYINASYINGYKKPKCYIATQGPNRYTQNDIWRMAWDNKSDRIVMVANLLEDGRRKCELYWPEEGSIECQDVTVTLVDVSKLAEFTIRTFKVKKTEDEKNGTRTIRQFHFTGWPDHGVPRYGTALLSFRKKIRSYDNPKSGPIIMHCSAGVGRTGTLIALDYCLDQAVDTSEIDPFDCVARLREQRVNMIQTEVQYIFLHDALLEALICPQSSFPCPEATDRFATLRQRNPDSRISIIDNQYETLSVVTKSLNSEEMRTALTAENRDKNRDMTILPSNNSRPYLLTPVDGGSDYINAVFVDGYKQKDAFIVTQMPLPCTVTDFWRMMYDHDSYTIVMLNEMDKNDSTCLSYWPESGSRIVEPFTISLKSVDQSKNHITIRNLCLTHNRKGKEKPRTIRHFQFHGWSATEELPNSQTEFLELMDQVEGWQQNSGNNSITLHCLDGVEKSGVYLAVVGTCEKIKLEREVDVFQTVKQIRENRPQFIKSANQFEFIYEAVVGYMESFETYANFK